MEQVSQCTNEVPRRQEAVAIDMSRVGDFYMYGRALRKRKKIFTVFELECFEYECAIEYRYCLI